MLSSGDEDDFEIAEQAMKCIYMSSLSILQKSWLPPVERDSLLLFD